MGLPTPVPPACLPARLSRPASGTVGCTVAALACLPIPVLWTFEMASVSLAPGGACTDLSAGCTCCRWGDRPTCLRTSQCLCIPSCPQLTAGPPEGFQMFRFQIQPRGDTGAGLLRVTRQEGQDSGTRYQARACGRMASTSAAGLSVPALGCHTTVSTARLPGFVPLVVPARSVYSGS
jgi:hypothetical protein